MAGTLLGIDLGGTKIEGIVLAADGTVIERRRISTERERGYDHIVGRVAALVADLRVHVPACRRVGIGTPGSTPAPQALHRRTGASTAFGRAVVTRAPQ